MEDKYMERRDLTEENTLRSDEPTTRIAREQETDRKSGTEPFGNIASPEGDWAGENRVTTSLNDD
ncbi:MAG TPA: hypothetical protein VFL47_09700 [Flavisolibacter sp.]|nr:hypothetical protein [Flavisolibacter sp.]